MDHRRRVQGANGGLSWVPAVFYSVGAAVIGMIAQRAYKLTRSSIGADRLRWLVGLVAHPLVRG